MEICGIICEYNPLHTGHAYHMQAARSAGADRVVCVMSGNFVQRADFALLRKHARAESAVLAGADLVLELPLPWALASAEGFARGGIGVLNSLGCVTHLCFGSETADIPLLMRTAELLDSPAFSQALQPYLGAGYSFPRARAAAARQLAPALASCLSQPNDILSIEYLKEIRRSGAQLIPYAVKRAGAAYHDLSLDDDHASASAIRAHLANHALSDVRPYLPEPSYQILLREAEAGNAPVFARSAATSILSCLKRMCAEDFASLPDISEGLEVRLEEAVRQASDLESAVMLAKTKRYTHSRIRRAFLSAFLGIRLGDSSGVPPYLRVLAFNDTGRSILAAAKKSACLPILTKPADAKALSPSARRIFELEARSVDLYALFEPVPKPGGGDWRANPIYVK